MSICRNRFDFGPTLTLKACTAAASSGRTNGALSGKALEPEPFASLTLRRTLVSWASVVETPMAGNQLSLTVHGALAIYDLPDLMRLLDAQRTTVEELRNAAGKPVSVK